MSENNSKPSRRQFLGTAGLVGAGAVLASCAPATAATPGKANLDVAIANFALNLEYLEGAFYLAAVGRIGELPGGSAQVILPAGFDGKTAVPFANPAVASYAQEIAQDELNHILFLRKVLGGAAVERPVLDIGPAFAAAANAAAGATLTPAFNPYLNDLFFLHGAFIFEDVGVTAYKGAARLITDDSAGGILESAAGILAVEAYHAGEIRALLYSQKDVVTPYGLTVAQLIQKISDLRGTVGGGKDQGIVVDGKANIVPTDSNSIAFSRSTAEVLPIVYLGGVGKGGFFPNGLNGAIK